MLGLSGYFIDTIVTRIVSMAAAATTTDHCEGCYSFTVPIWSAVPK